MLFISYLLFLLIETYYNKKDFYNKKDIDSYSNLSEKIYHTYSLNTLKKNATIIFIIDIFNSDPQNNWHGQMVLETMYENLALEYPHLKKDIDFKIIPIELSNDFNEIFLNYSLTQNPKINNYLFLKSFKEKYPDFKIGVNKSFVIGNVLSDIILDKRINDLGIFLSVASGNFQPLKNNDYSILKHFDNIIMKVLSFCKQFIFFTFFEDKFDSNYYKFNLNILNDQHFTSVKENQSVNIYKIYYSSEKSMENNFLFFAKLFPEYFSLAKTLSSSSATPIGLNNLLFRH